MFGMLMSVTTKSKRPLRSLFSATTPSSASSASAKPLSLSRLRTMRRMVEKSSTIRKRRAEDTKDPFGRNYGGIVAPGRGSDKLLPLRRGSLIVGLFGIRGVQGEWHVAASQQAFLGLVGEHGDGDAPVHRRTRVVRLQQVAGGQAHHPPELAVGHAGGHQ